ncbi:MAG: hypothetical protein WHW07_01225 [Bacteroidales bacterium]|jgi:hypothetical protein|nr:hypothetical protein [Bacteroidales bacterium]HOL97740.1 hypothetical protein [Bacteroidales bacterium]HOM36307.1 hypothetical protein [Bacteroidales bacterium]HPD23591.1 hypothetical protein [Bacteroidales bacterium]HRS99496.1 hypothetical protein [Bacteroidales bacterium]
MKNQCLVIIVTIFFVTFAYANDGKPTNKQEKIKIEYSGQILLAKDLKSNVYITFGGPGIKIQSGKIYFIAGMFPSLKYNYKYDINIDKGPLSPILGTGFQLGYKKFTAGIIFYSIKNNWHFAPGIGYKF